MSITKDKIRQEMKEVLGRISKIEYEQKSFQIAKELFQLKEWKEANTIGLTISNPPEVNTYFLIKQAWLEGKTVAVPKCKPKEKQLDFRIISSFTELENTYIHLLEPNIELTEPLAKKEIDLLIVPGLAFCNKGYRIGFGGGYYDRFLIDYEGNTIALAFQEQLLKEIPTDSYDLKVNRIILESGSFIC